MANSLISAGKITGLAELRNVLRALPHEMQENILGPAVAAGAKPVQQMARSLVSVRSGALKESIQIVVRKYKGNAVAIIGPAKGYYRGGERVGKGGDFRGAESPSKYAHLIEFGHVAVTPRKGTSRRKGTATEREFVAARPFMRPAVLAAGAVASEQIHRSVLQAMDRAINRARTA